MTIRLHEKLSPLRKLILSALVATMLGLAVPALASAAESWTVNSTGDQADQNVGNEVCATAGGKCTLRAAIEESNADGGNQAIFFDPTVFNGGATSTIELGSALPAFAPSGASLGEINGDSAGPCLTASLVSGPCVGIDGPTGGTTLESSMSGEMTVKGLALTGGSVGLEGLSSGPLTVEENWIGKKLDGSAAVETGTGINVADGAHVIGNSISGGQIGIHASTATSAGNAIRKNVIADSSSAGILVENSSNGIFGNQVTGAGVGIRIHEAAVEADENQIGGVSLSQGSADPDANVIDDSTGAAIEINTASSSASNRVLRNGGTGNGGKFISLVKKSPGEPKGPNNGIQPPVISAASLTEASGTAEKESFVRVYANPTTSEGELGTFLGRAEADPTTGEWSLSYSASPATAKIAASQTADEDEHGSSALSFTALPQFTLKVLKGGTGSGTVTSSATGINCGGQCEASFAKGGALKLVGAAASGSNPVSWAGCDAVNGANECEVTMSAAKSVTATFDLVPSTGGGGGGGGDTGSGGSSSGSSSGSGGSSGSTPPKSTPAPPTKPLKCKAGFKKKTVKGKARCVKVKKAHKKQH